MPTPFMHHASSSNIKHNHSSFIHPSIYLIFSSISFFSSICPILPSSILFIHLSVHLRFIYSIQKSSHQYHPPHPSHPAHLFIHSFILSSTHLIHLTISSIHLIHPSHLLLPFKDHLYAYFDLMQNELRFIISAKYFIYLYYNFFKKDGQLHRFQVTNYYQNYMKFENQ